jgi:hypothetical protein
MRRSKTSSPWAAMQHRVSGCLGELQRMSRMAAHQVAPHKLLHRLLVAGCRGADAHGAQPRPDFAHNAHQVKHRQVLDTRAGEHIARRSRSAAQRDGTSAPAGLQARAAACPPTRRTAARWGPRTRARPSARRPRRLSGWACWAVAVAIWWVAEREWACNTGALLARARARRDTGTRTWKLLGPSSHR